MLTYIKYQTVRFKIFNSEVKNIRKMSTIVFEYAESTYVHMNWCLQVPLFPNGWSKKLAKYKRDSHYTEY